MQRSLLIVVPRVPQAGRNAGDWRVYSLAVTLARDRNVFLLPCRPPGSGDRACIGELREKGVEILSQRYASDAGFIGLLRTFGIRDVMFEWYFTAHRFRKILPLIPRVIIDTHELRYVSKERRERILVGKRGDRLSAERETELGAYRMADALITVSPVERDALKAVFPAKEIAVVPMGTEVPASYQGGYDLRKDLVFFASFKNPGQRPSGNPNRDAVRYFIKEIFPLVRSDIPGARMHVAGAFAGGVAGAGIPALEDIRDIHSLLSGFRVFVCPLRFGAGVKKKILDAAAAGTPVVTTAIGSEGTFFRDGFDILAADHPRDFARKVVTLYRDRGVWERLSRNAYRTVKKHYAVEAVEMALGRTGLFGGIYGGR